MSRTTTTVRMRDAVLPLFLRRAASDTTNRWIYDDSIDGNTPAEPAPATTRAD